MRPPLAASVAAFFLCITVSVGASAQDATERAPTTWHDPSPHRIGFVGPEKHRVQYLDWGGQGPALVLLHGWNSNAHVFDDLAPRLTDTFHVVALTLPGFGDSDAPGAGYSLNAAADAVVGALDSLRIARASFAAHSFGGWITSRLATRYPTRIDRLIYLDAAFDLRASDSIAAQRPIQRPSTASLQTQDDVISWLYRNFFGTWTPALEAEYRGRSIDEEQRALVLRSIVAEAQRGPEEWSRVGMPTLAVCALAEVSSEFPWLSPQDSAYAVARKYVETVRRPFQHAECERFGRTAPNAQTLELAGHHFIFVVKQDQVVQAILAFLLKM